MRSRFDEQLSELNHEMIETGALCEQAILTVTEALTRGDAGCNQRLIPIDAQIEEKERELESMCLKLLMQQQPVARDLRQISAALKMVTDMERIGHQAEEISEIIGFLNGRNLEGETILPGMAATAIKMVTDSVDAFVRKDLKLADLVIASDDIVDRDFMDMRTELIEKIHGAPQDGEYFLDLMMISKYYERIADHAVNIAQWVIFSVTGDLAK